ncbi:MAG TPA: L,D-transpeptidase [Rhizomicrobium sp.]
MLRLRELAGVAGAAILAMAAVTAFPVLQTVQVSFRPEIAGKTLRLASDQANSALHLAFGGPPAPQKQPQPVVVPDPAVAMQQDAAGRLRSKIPADLYSYFDVYLYISKAATGSLAQHLYMFHKDAADNLVFEQSFPVSTGRERHEKYFTSTPAGLFELDPNRFERVHYSHTWNGAAMPFAMFLNATIKGRQTGVALHSASSHVAELGSRASGGCVRLPPEKAAELFQRFQAEERGMVPIFAYDAAHRRTSGDGATLRDSSGRPILTQGYRVLVFIEDYPGGPALVAVVA